MADYTYDQLKAMKVTELRTIAQGVENESLAGYTVMHKEQLLPVLCKVLGVEAPHHVAHGPAKFKIKQTIRALKKQRGEAVAAKDGGKLADIRHRIHSMKRQLRRMAV
jgi:protein-arginine kinase activator protein McsA